MQASRRSRWRHRPGRIGLEAALRDWLCEPASLTARLQRHGRFRISVLRQRLQHANADECALLGLSSRAPCWVREVVLFCDERPVVFAHTVLPSVPRGVLTRWFARLGSRSLGSLLFTHAGFVRGRLSFARIDRRHPLYRDAVAALGVAPGNFDARRCLHAYRGQRVLVTEVFLPGIATLMPRDREYSRKNLAPILGAAR